MVRVKELLNSPKCITHGKVPYSAKVRHIEAKCRLKSEPRIQPQVGAEARCMSYAIDREAGRGLTEPTRTVETLGSIYESAAALPQLP